MDLLFYSKKRKTKQKQGLQARLDLHLDVARHAPLNQPVAAVIDVAPAVDVTLVDLCGMTLV